MHNIILNETMKLFSVTRKRKRSIEYIDELQRSLLVKKYIGLTSVKVLRIRFPVFLSYVIRLEPSEDYTIDLENTRTDKTKRRLKNKNK